MDADFLVIGSGIAGLTFALDAAERGRVLLVTKKRHTESNTNYAQGGIAAVVGKGDTFSQHVHDTLEAGAGLCNRRAVRVMVQEGPQRLKELMARGVEFSTYWEGGKRQLALGREGGHHRDRIVHRADQTGAEVEQSLVRRALEHPNITVEEHSAALDLIVTGSDQHRRCSGAWVLTRDGGVEPRQAQVVFLATGGCGQVYLHTTNPDIATGDGLALARRAGVRLANLEFMQFHPTALYTASVESSRSTGRETDGPVFLISEAVRGFGGILRLPDGHAFMRDYHPLADLAPRDIVARAIDREMKSRGLDHLWLDITSRRPDEVRERFPGIYRACLKQNLDITREWIPVVPAAHYMCGGVVTDIDSRSSLRGLYAAGEVAMSGVHGANRLASNSLLEAVVFAHRAAMRAALELEEISAPVALPDYPVPLVTSDGGEEWVLVSSDREQIRRLMTDYVGIVRSNLRLERAHRRVELIRREIDDLARRSRLTLGLVELRNIALVASLIIRSALRRRESRGLHWTTDYPEPSRTGRPRNTYLWNRTTPPH